MYFVYELVDPRTDVTGYVGITNNPNRRYCEHLERSEGNGEKDDWIQCLQEEQIQPKMKILEIVDNLEQARKQELHWVQYYIDKGVQLTNIRLREGKEKVILTRVALKDYYTGKQVKDILDINSINFSMFIQKGLVINALPDRQNQFGYYLKEDIDRLATDLKAFREKHAGRLVPYTISCKRE